MNQLSQAIRNNLDIPFNDFEMYHSPTQTGTPEKGGNCIYLMRRFLDEVRGDFRCKIIRSLEMVHYGILGLDDGDESISFYDPFLRMSEVAALPERVSSVIFAREPKNALPEISYELVAKVKKRKNVLQLKKHKGGKSHVIYTYNPNEEAEVIQEIDATFERKNSLGIELYPVVNNTRTRLKTELKVRDSLNYLIAAHSDGSIGNERDEPAIFARNFGQVADHLGFESPEYLRQYIMDANSKRVAMRKERFAQDR